MKIKNFDLATTKMITPQLTAALDAVSKELGVKVDLTCKSFGKMYAQFKLIVNVDDGMTLAERDFNRYAPEYGITEKVGDIVLSHGQQFRIVGWQQSARRFPIVRGGSVRWADVQVAARDIAIEDCGEGEV
jgi:hypothetical protein